METDTPLAAAPKSSLIVKLRCQPLCATCADMLPRWCEPPAKPSAEQYWPPEQYWYWSIKELTQRSSTCHCCRFLIRVLKASPWIQTQTGNRTCVISVGTRTIGSQHMAKTPDHLVSRTYYRPLLYVDDGSRPYPTYGSFILPVSRVQDVTSDELDPPIFCGRSVNAMVDMSLIASWLKICTSRHDNSADGHGCCPNIHEPLQDFRVIDVQQRCVVRTSGKVDYAALSYVWGDAKRLVLSKDNEAWLTTPGSLSRTEENVPKTFRDALEVAAALGVANLWVDAICIDQSDSEQVENHMDAMDKIYGSAVLTIVATAENTDLGLPGIGFPRGPSQAVFEYNGTRYLSSKLTFGAALADCPWQKRAWCLQEKLFSARLLIFTDTQAFYHCGAATWFEDTIMEISESKPTVILKERASSHKERLLIGYATDTVYGTRYSALEDVKFWSLVRDYSKRKMTFEADVIRAFAGILRSVEAEHGYAIWGIPQHHLLQGLLWYHSKHQMNSRREGFPSWSWVGWRSRDNGLHFANCEKEDTDIVSMNGRYLVAQDKHVERSVWDLSWHYYTADEYNGQFQFKAVELGPPKHIAEPQGCSFTSEAALPTEPETSEISPRYEHLHEWGLPGHPGDMEFTQKPVLPLECGPQMPPLSHILQFYTSVAPVLVLLKTYITCYSLFIPGTDIELAAVDIDSLWSGIGKVHSLVYISSYCPNYYYYQQENDAGPEKLRLLLVESVPKWGEVKRRVQLVQNVSILDWRKANPRWELVSLA